MDYFPENRGQYLYIKLSGKFDTRGFTFGFPLLLNALKENRIEKLLLDCREVNGLPSIEERLFVNESLADMYLNFLKNSPQLNVAITIYKSMLHPDRTGEKIAKNRGLNMKITENIEEAYKWLEVTPPKTMTQPAETAQEG